jgi:hypothetical protein
LEIATCPNQDPLEATTGLFPLFGKDQLDGCTVFIKSDVKQKVAVGDTHLKTGDLAIVKIGFIILHNSYYRHSLCLPCIEQKRIEKKEG